MLEEIRKTGLYFTWMVLTAGQIGSQTDAAGPQRLSSEAFETAFRQVMDASDDCFRSLAGSGSLRIFGSEYQQITLRFPGEVLAGYTCKVYHEAYGTTTVNDIHVLYHDGSNSGQALSVYKRLKTALLQCREQRIGGEWAVDEITEPDAGRTGTVTCFRMFPADGDKPLVILNYCNLGPGNISVHLFFTRETVE